MKRGGKSHLSYQENNADENHHKLDARTASFQTHSEAAGIYPASSLRGDFPINYNAPPLHFTSLLSIADFPMEILNRKGGQELLNFQIVGKLLPNYCEVL